MRRFVALLVAFWLRRRGRTRRHLHRDQHQRLRRRARSARRSRDANADAGADTIAFNVSGAGCDGSGVCTITTASVLPAILTARSSIDGYTQPGSSPNTNAAGRAQHGAEGRALRRQPRPAGDPDFRYGRRVRPCEASSINGGFGDAFQSFVSDGDTSGGLLHRDGRLRDGGSSE